MKRINKILGLGVLLFSMSGCNNFLDKGVLDSFTNDNFWSGEGNVESYANTFYNAFTGYGNGSGFGLFYFKTLSDDQAGNSFTDWSHLNSLTSNSTWNSSYTEIRRASEMIEKIPGMDLTDAVKEHWLGVARLMRAYYYHQLTKTFGDVPYVDKVLATTDEDVVYGPRVNRDEVMDKALEDLNYAASHINDVTTKTAWSRSMANAMKADICLWEGTFRKYRSAADGQPAADQAGATKFLNACKEACEAIMAKSYSLNASYQGNYNSTDLSGNPEMIFYKHYVTNILCHSLIDYTCTSTQMSGITKSAFDAYLFTDGKPKATTSCDTNDVAPLIDGKLSLDAILAVRDKRLSETIDHVLLYNGNSNARAAGDMEQTSSTGYGIAKYDNTSLPLGDRNTGNKNYTDAPIFWLSVVYLNYVEACAELGSLTDAQLNGFNQLRARAGLPDATVASLSAINDPANNHGVSSLLWEIRRERRCELMMDNDFRYWDLVRWHQLDKLDSTKYPDILRGANVKNDPSCEADKVGDYIDGRKGRDRAYDKKYYLYPVPSGQSDLNPALLPNNPGW